MARGPRRHAVWARPGPPAGSAPLPGSAILDYTAKLREVETLVALAWVIRDDLVAASARTARCCVAGAAGGGGAQGARPEQTPVR